MGMEGDPCPGQPQGISLCGPFLTHGSQGDRHPSQWGPVWSPSLHSGSETLWLFPLATSSPNVSLSLPSKYCSRTFIRGMKMTVDMAPGRVGQGSPCWAATWEERGSLASGWRPVWGSSLVQTFQLRRRQPRESYRSGLGLASVLQQAAAVCLGTVAWPWESQAQRPGQH